jgi:RNA polymerase sigma factor (sigma-70 family)
MYPSSNPSDPTREDDRLFARAQAGDQTAWDALFKECYPKVRRVVRRRISHGPLRRYFDSTDIANDVFGELATKASRFEFATVEDVRNFLIDAAHKRVIDEHRRYMSRKRDSKRERAMTDGDSGLSSSEPTPSQHAVAHETDLMLNAASSDDGGRRVLIMRREQYNNEEISRETGWSLRKVQRFLEKLRPIFLN